MKLWKWILIITGFDFIYIIAFLVLQIIIKKSWWWVFCFPIFLMLIIEVIVILIILLIKTRKKEKKEEKIDFKNAKAKAIYENKYDDENPDNFVIIDSLLLRIGEKGAEKTPIAVFSGYGHENNDRRVFIINLTNDEFSSVVDKDIKYINDAINKIANNPPEEQILEETEEGTDLYGRPIRKIKIKRPSSAEVKRKEEEKKAEEGNAM